MASASAARGDLVREVGPERLGAARDEQYGAHAQALGIPAQSGCERQPERLRPGIGGARQAPQER